MIKYIKCFTLIILFAIKIVNAQADDSYIRKGINDVLYTSSPEYIEKLYGEKDGPRLKKITVDYWWYIGNALDAILAMKNIPGFHIIAPRIAGALKYDPPVSEKIDDPDATAIGLGLQEYARGAR